MELVLAIILAILLIRLMFYLFSRFLRSIDNEVKGDLKSFYTEEEWEIVKKNYYGLEDAFKSTIKGEDNKIDKRD